MLAIATWLCLVGPAAGLADELWSDEFTGSQTYERWGPRCWEIADGALGFRAGQEASYQIPRLPDLTEATTTCELTATERTRQTYVWAGLTLFVDPTNQWQLSLVESPQGKRYFELLERLDGVQHAQAGGGTSATKLPMTSAGELGGWEYGQACELELALTPESITGTVTDPRTGEYWQRSYKFDGGRALMAGRPGMLVSGMEGTFREFRIDGSLPEPEEGLAIESGPRGSVAIIDSREGGLAEKWADEYRKAGYGATAVAREDLRQANVPVGEVDLLVLADATAVPLRTRDSVTQLLRCAGKLIAIGAPAFTELLTHTPEGWVDRANYAEAIIAELELVDLDAPVDEWRFAAMQPDSDASLRAADDALEFDIDHDGWGGFSHDITGAYDEDRTLLTFWARGDDQTSQMHIEFREEDGSRWIGTIGLTPEWRAHMLQPRDFPYWKDSPAPRGWEGDHFHPENVQQISLGLSQSHTPRVRKGRHKFWVQGLSTAPDPDHGNVDFSVPQIQALSPSYHLFPMQTPAKLTAGLRNTTLEMPNLTWREDAYAPVWRERGRGFDRDRSWRWIPLLEVRDDYGFHRGALVSLTVGDAVNPDAMWANVGVANAEDAFTSRKLREAVMSTSDAITRGCFLIEAGAPVFSCKPGETMELGAEVLNASAETRELTVEFGTLIGGGGLGGGMVPATERRQVVVEAGKRATVTLPWVAPKPPSTCHVFTTLTLDGAAIDRIAQEIVVGPRPTPSAADYVRVEGSHFMLGDEKWFFNGVNYRPTFVGGYPHLNFLSREVYDPEIVERDLAWLESAGINALSAIHGVQPANADSPWAYRDQLDFLDRCERHGIKVFFFLSHARPFADADADRAIDYISQAGLANHPAIMCWELAWEPIHGSWGDGQALAFMLEPWNDWVAQRYGSVENAVADWEYEPEMVDGALPVPSYEMTLDHGEWDRMVAAFRRAFSDTLSRGYRDIVSRLREAEPSHLISFRFGACGIPNGPTFAHAHSQGVLKHVDFMNPEGYSLIKGWGIPTPADDLRKGGLVTLYYRHFSREKPVVWMEFGYTVNGIHDAWEQGRIHIDPNEIANQTAEYESLYAMFIESGARGAAPWWLPGGFRLGENSDFGMLRPDGSERPVCEVVKGYLPQFAEVQHEEPTAFIDLDLDSHYPDAWDVYSAEYLKLVQAGERPHVRTAGTGTTSASCPLTAVGGTDYNGHNPPAFLNAEFNSLEIRGGDGDWIAVDDGSAIDVPVGKPVRCRASVGNIGEATWLGSGEVSLAGRAEYGLEFSAPIDAETEFLRDAQVSEFVLVPRADGETTVSFEMQAQGRAYFGERRTIVLRAMP